MNAAIIVGFRDRGTDPLRAANLKRTLEWWANFGADINVVTDGLSGSVSFNRHAAYNRGAAQTNADVLCFVESDMLLDFAQMDHAIELAIESTGLVVPFTERHEFGAHESDQVRNHQAHPRDLKAEVVKPKPRRTGAINVISRETYNAVGQYDSAFSGCWFDDRSMHIAFDICAGPTRWIDGPSWHLHHLPGYQGEHLTDEDRAATAANKSRWQQYTKAQTPDQIRRLTSGKNIL